jgi:sortase A
VLLPVPDEPESKATVAVLTLTSCHPEFSARERFVVHAELDAAYPREKGVPADVLKVGE